MDDEIQFNSGLWSAGAVLALFGAVLVAVGALLSGNAVLSAVRQWIRSMETPPSETVKGAFRQFSRASMAGFNAWQNEMMPPPEKG